VNLFTKHAPRKIVLGTLAVAGLAALVTGATLRADTATTKPVALPEPTVKETAPDPVLATVDGIPIDREKFNGLLMAIGGPRLFEQVITYVLAQEACDKGGIEIKPSDTEAEKTRMLAGIGERYPDLKDAKDREQALGILLQRQGVTALEFQLSLQRAACLRKLATGKAVPTDKEVTDAWDANNAEKVDVLDIVVKDFNEASELRKFVEKEKKAPTELANSKGARMNEFTISAVVPQTGAAKDLKELAFQVKEGDLSAAKMIGGGDGKPGELHVMYCVKKIPATGKVATEAEKADLKKKMTEAYESRWADAHLRKLMNEARIDIKDKTLSAYYQAVNAQAAQARAAAASQAASQPTTAPK